VSAATIGAATFSAVIVDDTPDLRLLLRITLEQEGDFQVVAEAENGQQGVEQIAALKPDLVLLDLAMPVMDGLEALPRIREVCPSARVVVLSGFEADAMAHRAMSAGADGYLQKGMSPRRILHYVRRLLTGNEAVPGTNNLSSEPLVTEQAPPGHAYVDAMLADEGDHAARTATSAAVGLVLVVAPAGDATRATLRYANAAAGDLLALPEGGAGSPLAEVAPRLQSVLARRLPDVRAGAETWDRTAESGRALDLVMRRGDQDEVVVSVHRAARLDEAAVLRQAISTTAHEIRNPVTLLSGVAQVLRTNGRHVPPDQVDRLLGAVGRQTLILERLTDDLLTAAQAGRGSLRVDVRPVVLAEALADALGDVKEFDDVLVQDASGVLVLADADRLSQMLANLLGNAVKYGEAPYAVTVRDGDGSGLVHVDVSDSGPGVDEGFRDQLFDEFTRADDASARGTGLGLFVVRSLAEVQGGQAGYRPREGGGSVFTISLPAVPPTYVTGRPDSV